MRTEEVDTLDERLRQRAEARLAQEVTCTACGAFPGEPCRMLAPGRPLMERPHVSRVRAAMKR